MRREKKSSRRSQNAETLLRRTFPIAVSFVESFCGLKLLSGQFNERRLLMKSNSINKLTTGVSCFISLLISSSALWMKISIHVQVASTARKERQRERHKEVQRVKVTKSAQRRRSRNKRTLNWYLLSSCAHEYTSFVLGKQEKQAMMFQWFLSCVIRKAKKKFLARNKWEKWKRNQWHGEEF